MKSSLIAGLLVLLAAAGADHAAPQASPGPQVAEDAVDVPVDVHSPVVAVRTQRVSEQVRAILEHFKQDDPTGFPGAEVPDPMSVPAMNSSFAIATMNFDNVSVNGLSRFRFHEASVNLTTMKAGVTARIDKVLILGNYTLCTWFSCSAGGFTVSLDVVLVSGVAGLEVGPGGRLRAEEIAMDVTFDSIAMDFKNLGLMMSMFQGIINKVGSFLFDNVKPFILSEVNNNIRAEVDKQVAGVDVRFPSSMAPVDVLIADARRHVRKLGYDPFHLPDITKTAGPVEATLTHLFATGLSSFYRKGELSLWMRGHVLHAGLHLATRQLRGTLRWKVHAPQLPQLLYPLLRRAGDASFTIEYLEARLVFNQSLDTRKHPYLESLDLNMGPVTLVSHGDAGRLNALSEFGVNVLPNLLRYQIVNALEEPITQRVQQVLDTVDVEAIINERLPELDGVDGVDDNRLGDGGPVPAATAAAVTATAADADAVNRTPVTAA